MNNKHNELDPLIYKRSLNARTAGILIVYFVAVAADAITDGYFVYFSLFMLFALIVNLLRTRYVYLAATSRRFFMIENSMDILGALFITQLTGGPKSIFTLLYIFPVIYVVMVRGAKLGSIIAGLGALCIGISTWRAMVMGDGTDVLSSQIVMIMVVFGTAIFAGYFSDELLRQTRKMERMNRRLSHRSAELQRGKQQLELYNADVRKARDKLDEANRHLSDALQDRSIQEQKVSAVISSIANGVFVVDRDQKIDLWNQGAQEITGFLPTEVLGRTCAEVFVTPDRSERLECFESCDLFNIAGQRKKAHSHTFQVLHKNRHKIWLEFSVSPVLDTSGRTIGMVHVFQNVTDEHRDRAVLKKQAITDELTELFNRRFLVERLNEEMERAKRYEQPIALLMVDIDHFKVVNDEHGHQAGDVVLKKLAVLFRQNLRRSDFIARYGGEEFIIILPNVKEEDPLEVSEKVRKAVEQHVFQAEGIPLHITISIGVVVYAGEDITAHTFVKGADSALYMAKRAGRNRVVMLPEGHV